MGTFNIFKLSDDKQTSLIENKRDFNGNLIKEKLLVDTSTYLYTEALATVQKHNTWLLGRSPARGNDSAYFGDFTKETLKTGKQERFSNEASILNIFTWLGVVGVLLYFLIFIKASYLAINQSNNIFIKLIGLNVAFRWAYGWVEDFSNFDLSNIFL